MKEKVVLVHGSTHKEYGICINTTVTSEIEGVESSGPKRVQWKKTNVEEKQVVA